MSRNIDNHGGIVHTSEGRAYNWYAARERDMIRCHGVAVPRRCEDCLFMHAMNAHLGKCWAIGSQQKPRKSVVERFRERVCNAFMEKEL